MRKMACMACIPHYSRLVYGAASSHLGLGRLAFREGSMSKPGIVTACLLGVVVTVWSCLASPQAPTGPQQDGKAAAIVGAWQSIDRHVAIASLFQPQHGVRKREGVVHFTQDGDRLSGHAIAEDFPDRKNGRCDFRTVKFADGRLTFEYDITFSKQHGPLAVEEGRIGNKGTVRVEAVLQKDRFAGTWKVFLADGTEVFRGE